MRASSPYGARLGERGAQTIMWHSGAAFGGPVRVTIGAPLDLADAWRSDAMVHDPFQAALPLVGAGRAASRWWSTSPAPPPET